MRIAFYAPIKPPEHPIPSGDRLIARNLVKALELAGHSVEIASSFIAYSKRADADILASRKSQALEEADEIIAAKSDQLPDLWLTYHPYCKAPDWIGPRVSAALGIPYVTVEAAKTGQGFENGGDLWVKWRAEAQEGIRKADLHLCFKPTDKAYLTDLIGETERIVDLAPFIDTAIPDPLPDADLSKHWREDVPVIMSVGMMRPGKKLENFRMIAEALEPLQALPWNLLIAGGGPELETVKSLFSYIDSARIHLTGQLEHAAVLALMRRADLFLWPGWKEPIGMVYLEAQMMGLPVAALDSMGVPLVVAHGKTGLLAPENRLDKLTSNLEMLLSHPGLRRDYADEAPRHIERDHSLLKASKRLDNILSQLVARA